jgi:glycosyltransferase involved in cell wall biosynthesis
LSIAILLPALNEEKSIGKVIDGIKSLYIKDCRIVVVDSMSTDKTKEIALSKGAMVLNVPGKGKGIAIRRAFELICDDYYIMLDSDGTYPTGRIPDILKMLKEYDVVMCPRIYKEKGSMPLLNSLGNWFLTRLANFIYETDIKDLCTGMWGFRRSFIKDIELVSKGFTLEAELFIRTVEEGYSLGELPIKYSKRIDKPKLKLWDGGRIAWFLIKN